jgi:hypothetical protein
MKEYVQLLTEQGFAPHPHHEHFGVKVGQELPGVYYAHRCRLGVHEYVSLVSYEGKFCEAVYEAFAAKKNTYQPKGNVKSAELAKRGFLAVLTGLPRNLPDLTVLVSKSEQEVASAVEFTLKQMQLADKAK